MSRAEVRAHPFSQLPPWLQRSDRSECVPVFASDQWLSILEHTFGFQGEMLCASTRSGLETAAPLLGRQRFFLRVSPPPPITLYNGFVMSHPVTAGKQDTEMRTAATAIIDAVAARYHYAALALPIGCPATETFRGKRWRLLPQHTIRIAMPDFETVWKGYSQSLRRKIRRAEEHGLRLIETDDVERIASLYALSYERHGMLPPIPPNIIRDWLRVLHREGIARVFAAALPDGAVAAARAVIPDRGIVYDWLAGADLTAADISASHWLVANIQRAFTEQGFHTFDFMGANTPGIVDFKRSFGGDTLPYHLAVYYRSPMIRTVEGLRNNLRRRRRSAR
jgi:hypothetical protein